MQRMDSLDSGSSKIVFKKRSHRPWNPTASENAQILFEPNHALNNFDSERLLIGGFSFPNASKIAYESGCSQKSTALMDELKNKEQEIQTLSTNLKIASALEQAEKIELARKKETVARKIAEEKASSTIQQLNINETELHKVKQQLHAEQQLKTKEESLKKSLEVELKNALCAIEDNENVISREIEIRKIAEEKLNETLNMLSDKEHQLRLQAEKNIKDNLREFIEREKNIEHIHEDRLNTLQNEYREQMLSIQNEAMQKISESEKKANLKIENEKTNAENRLTAVLQNATHHKSQLESTIHALQTQIKELDEKIAVLKTDNTTLKQQASENLSRLNTAHQTENNTAKHIEHLNAQIQALTKKSALLENEKNELTQLFTDTLGKSKILQSTADIEKQLRILLEKKLSGSELRKIEINKKLFENKVIELAEKIGALEIEKAESQEKQANALKQAHKVEILMASETTIKKSLEDKNQALTEQIYQLEEANQKEIHEKEMAKYKISELMTAQQRLEKEKNLVEEKNDKLLPYINQLERDAAADKIAAESLEKSLSSLIKQQQQLIEDKEYIEKKLMLTLECLSTTELALEDEKNLRFSLQKKVEMLIERELNLEQEKTNLKTMHNNLAEKFATLEIRLASEQSLRKETERLKLLEEQTRKAAQERISSAMEQANQTVLTVLGNYTTAEATDV